MTYEMNRKVQKSLGFYAKEMMIFPCKRISKMVNGSVLLIYSMSNFQSNIICERQQWPIVREINYYSKINEMGFVEK